MQPGATSIQKNGALPVSAKPASGKNLPDILSLEKAQSSGRSTAGQNQEKSQVKTAEPDIIS